MFRVELYNIKTHSFIYTLPLGRTPRALAFSPNCTRLAVGEHHGDVTLWDIRGVDASRRPPSKGNATAVTALALSRDCSRLACGFEDGRVELSGTIPTKPRIGQVLRSKMEAIFRQSRHTDSVEALGFSPDGRLFASGSDDGTIKLWNGGDGALRGTITAPSSLQAVALSNNVLVATWGRWYDAGVTLWSLDTLSRIHTFRRSDDEAFKVSIADNSTLLTVFFRHGHVDLLDVVNRTTIATFHLPYDLKIHTMAFLPDNSQLVIQSEEGVFLSLNRINKRIIQGPTLEHLIQLPNIPLWHRIPIWFCWDKVQHCVSALFSQNKCPVPVLWIPRDLHVVTWTQGSSTIALGCEDGRVIIIRLPTNTV
ncbi:hypothetical protein M378DRAFT_165860, partial [Amanita muscaria Koide BX008]